MPQEFRQVNGRWQVVGSASSDELLPTVPEGGAVAAPSKPKPRPRPKPKGFLEQLQNNLAYEIKQIRRDPLKAPANLSRRAVGAAARAVPVAGGAMVKEAQKQLPRTPAQAAVATAQAMNLLPRSKDVALGALGAGDNMLKFGEALYQRHVLKQPKADPGRTGFGQAREGWVDALYGAFGSKKPSEMNPNELMGDQVRRSVALNVGASALTGGAGGIAQAAGAAGKVAALGRTYAVGELISNYFDDNTGGNLINLINTLGGFKLPGAVKVGQDDWIDAANKSLIPNALPGAALGVMGSLVNTARRIKAGKAVEGVTSARQRLIDQGLIEKTDSGFRFTEQAAEKPRTLKEANDQMEALISGQQPGGDVAAMRAQIAANQAQIEKLRAQQLPFRPMGVRQTGPNYLEQSQDYARYQEWLAKSAPEPEPPPAPGVRLPALDQAQLDEAANAALYGRKQSPVRPPSDPVLDPWTGDGMAGGIPAGPAPARAAAADPWADGADTLDELDPALPEADVIVPLVDDLDDDQLTRIAATDGPVVPQIAQALEGRPEPIIDPRLRTDTVTAPTSALSELFMDGFEGPTGARLEPWSVNIDSLNADKLKALAHPENSPDLYARIFSRTGKEWEELSKGDILGGIRDLSDAGETVIPNRLTQDWALANEIDAEPARFQFKQNVDELGQQAGNSLEGVGKWNPYAEGNLLVWRDPADGRMKVVDGHNRLALAKRLGIKSVPTTELFAPNAGAARAQGALSNIAKGDGTAFDAAKFIRETGMTDPAQLEAAGIPLSSGLGRQGLALSRLPDDLFQAAVDGRLPLRKAVIIGDTSLSPERMRTAFAEVVKNPDLKESELRELVTMGEAAPTVEARQGELPTGYEYDQGMISKARVTAAVKEALLRDRKVFSTTAKNAGRLTDAGNVIDKVGAEAISTEANRALRLLDEQKLLSGPVSDLLNEGAALVAQGQRPGDVANGIKNRLAAVLKELMGQEVKPATDVLQEDMFAAAGRLQPAEDVPVKVAEPPAVVTMPAEQRAQLQADLLQRAAAQGEIRPPATPEPILPEPPLVTPLEAAEDILRNGGIVPGSKGAQALADEIRLADDYRLQDAMTRQDTEDALRDAYGYEAKTFEEKKALGLTEDWDTGTPKLIEPEQIGDGEANQLMGLYELAPESFGGKWFDPRRINEPPSPRKVEELTVKLGSGDAVDQALAAERAAQLKLTRQLLDQSQLAAAMKQKGSTDNEIRLVLGLEPRPDGDVLPTTVIPDQPTGPKIADVLRDTMKAMAESDARLYRGIGESLQGIKANVAELAGDAPKAPSIPQRRLLEALAGDGDLTGVRQSTLQAAERKGWIARGEDATFQLTDAGRQALQPPGPRVRALPASDAAAAGGPVINERTAAATETIRQQLQGTDPTPRSFVELVNGLEMANTADSKRRRQQLLQFAKGLDQIEENYQKVVDTGLPERIEKMDTRRKGFLKNMNRILDELDSKQISGNAAAMDALRVRAIREGCQ
jgi:hypothetical protein